MGYVMSKDVMSVLTKGSGMDFEKQEKKEMVITSIWPAVFV